MREKLKISASMVCAIIIKLAFTMLPTLQNHIQVSVDGMENGFLTYTTGDITNFHFKLKMLGPRYTRFESANGYINTICSKQEVNNDLFLNAITRTLGLEKGWTHNQDDTPYEKILRRECSNALLKNRNLLWKLSDVLSENHCSEVDILTQSGGVILDCMVIIVVLTAKILVNIFTKRTFLFM